MNLHPILSVLPTGSWCSKAKATRMAELIFECKPKTCVEIGVFGGDSLFVIAAALREVGAGIVHGIDPWDKTSALEGMDPAGPNAAWWSTLDYEAIYRGAQTKRKAFKLEPWCELIRSRSTDEQMLTRFGPKSVDFLHLDGNHGKEQCLGDVEIWLPRLADRSVLVVDDLGWVEGGQQTVYPVFQTLINRGWELDGMVGDCGFLRKPVAA